MQSKQLIAILGGGESGVGAALLAHARGFRVLLSDQGSIGKSHKASLVQAGIPFEEGSHSLERLEEAIEVVKSPGVPEFAPVVSHLREKGIPVISEIEFAARYTKGLIVGVTGTNGKTTTTRLAYHLIRTAGFIVGIGGNVGNSFAREVIEDRFEYYVLELSSFQLDNIERFQPHIAMVLNITPDHLDRYNYEIENYADAKLRIAKNLGSKDFFIYNVDDPQIISAMERASVRAQKLPLPMESGAEGAPLLVGGHSFILNNPVLKGRHNRFNAQCAIQAALLLGALPQAIQNGLDTFVNDPHRMEKVEEWNDILFLNDSKATNVEAVYFALEAMTQPVVWIAGGTDKGNDYTPLLPFAKEKVKALICLGVDNAKLIESFRDAVQEIVEVGSAEEAVNQAIRFAESGDVVLLSPACASFDLFLNYEDRGEQFKKAVRDHVSSLTN